MKCPTCLGKGVQTITVYENGRKQPSFQMTCVNCNGKGTVSAAKVKAEKDFWCDCPNPDMGNAEFYNDGENPKCHKHNWVCRDCGKVLQVG